MTAMRAARFHQYGPPTALAIEDVERPEPGKGQVQVKVHTAGVNPIDWKLRKGVLKDFMPVQLPHIGGFDLAGTVEKVGPGVTEFEVGQAVFGRGNGAYAEYAVAAVASLARKPEALSFEQAASIPIGAATAWAAVFVAVDLQPGQRVLIHGAAGGVGLWAVQLAHGKGAHVIGTASTPNVDYVRTLGADEVIDYTSTRFEDVVHDVDAVIDTVGGELEDRSLTVLRKGGVYTTIAGQPSSEKAAKFGVRVAPVESQATTEILSMLARMVVDGTLRPEVSEVFPLDRIQQAHELSETGHGRGRIVIAIR